MQGLKGWTVGILVLCCAALSGACLGPAFSRPSSRTDVTQPRPAARPALRPDPAVRQVQGILHEHGYDPGPLDGLMGRQTRRALRQFQQDHNLPALGQLDAATQTALFQPPDTRGSEARR